GEVGVEVERPRAAGVHVERQAPVLEVHAAAGGEQVAFVDAQEPDPVLLRGVERMRVVGEDDDLPARAEGRRWRARIAPRPAGGPGERRTHGGEVRRLLLAAAPPGSRDPRCTERGEEDEDPESRTHESSVVLASPRGASPVPAGNPENAMRLRAPRAPGRGDRRAARGAWAGMRRRPGGRRWHTRPPAAHPGGPAA